MAYIDGTVPYGAQAVTLYTTAITPYSAVAEAISFETPSHIIEQMDALGNPTGQAVIEVFGTGTATIQLATTSSPLPKIGTTFTGVHNDGTTSGFVVSQVGEPQAQYEYRKVTVNLRKRYNS